MTTAPEDVTTDAQREQSLADMLTSEWAVFECLPAKPGTFCVGIPGGSFIPGYEAPRDFVTGWGVPREVAERIVALHNATLTPPTEPVGWVITQQGTGDDRPTVWGGLLHDQDQAAEMVENLNATAEHGRTYTLAAVASGGASVAPSVGVVLRQLTEAHDLIAELRQDADEYHALLERQSDILDRTAVALKGEPAPLSSHSHADLPEVAAALRAAADTTDSA